MTDLMHMTVQPCQQMLEFTAVKVSGQAMGSLIRFCQLRCIQAADCIRREIAEHPNRPVRILQHAIAVTRR